MCNIGRETLFIIMLQDMAKTLINLDFLTRQVLEGPAMGYRDHLVPTSVDFRTGDLR